MIRRNTHRLFEMIFLQHNSEEVDVVKELEVEVGEVEEKIAILVEVIFSPPIVIKMVTLKVIPFDRKEIPLIQISARKKVKNIKLYFSCNKCNKFK